MLAPIVSLSVTKWLGVVEDVVQETTLQTMSLCSSLSSAILTIGQQSVKTKYLQHEVRKSQAQDL